MDNIFNISVNKDEVKSWSINFNDVTDSVKMKLGNDLKYRRFISNTSYTYNKDNVQFTYLFVIEYFLKDEKSYYTLSIVPDKYSLYKDRVDEVIEAFSLDSIDDLTENICFDYGYGITIGQVSSEIKEFEPILMNEISYVTTIMKDIIQFYLNQEDNGYGTKKIEMIDFLCNNINFM